MNSDMIVLGENQLQFSLWQDQLVLSNLIMTFQNINDYFEDYKIKDIAIYFSHKVQCQILFSSCKTD